MSRLQPRRRGRDLARGCTSRGCRGFASSCSTGRSRSTPARLSGGYVKIAAERAAFIAASRDEPITMAVLTATIERMYRERGKLSTVGKLE